MEPPDTAGGSGLISFHSLSRAAMPTRKKPKPDVLKVAREHFGFEALRPGQRDAIEALLEGRDCVVVQPTGAGKSAIYQIAGLMIQGVTLVVSPLIALQKDQVDAIAERDAAEAVLVNSLQRAEKHRETMERIDEGAVEYILLAPEQLRREETMSRLEAAGVSLFVIDEAHCISEWGHDFRPDYLEIGAAIERLGHPVTLAMTATASPDVRAEIADRLGLRDPMVVVQGFDRPNISLRVDHFNTEKEKLEALVKRVRWADKPGIVYVGTRKNAEQIMRTLADEGVHALFYHAGLKPKERDAIQEQFMSGEAEVIVATNAFGMGVDKPDIRFVYHFDISPSLDAYYQEIGRAGRDGEKAEATLFYRNANVGTQKFRAGRGKLDKEQVRAVAEAVADKAEPVAPREIAEVVELSDRRTISALHRLADVGALDVLPTGEVEVGDGVDLDEATRKAAERQQEHQRVQREKLERMQEYADSSGCRRQILLRYFGDDFTGPCDNCDNCLGTAAINGKSAGIGIRREVA
jgi:ATP-dependent DNA helicase RecQ